MKLVICDIPDIKLSLSPEDAVILPDERLCRCTGCFGCWLKTPGKCVLKDGYEGLGGIWGKCDEAIIISRCVYGGFAPFVKNILDRSISYVHPDFRLRKGEMHHRRRYDNKIRLSVYYYGDTTEYERETAKRIAEAVTDNFDAALENVRFFASREEVKL